MRDIRFRAWDKYKEKMIDLGDLESISMRNTAGYDDDFANYELMQFTGLFDKNGKEIWEGDIVRSKDTPHLIVPYCTFKVVWSQNNYSDPWAEFCLVGINLANDISFRRLRESVLAPIEVIGNIHENPELLGDK